MSPVYISSLVPLLLHHVVVNFLMQNNKECTFKFVRLQSGCSCLCFLHLKQLRWIKIVGAEYTINQQRLPAKPLEFQHKNFIWFIFKRKGKSLHMCSGTTQSSETGALSFQPFFVSWWISCLVRKGHIYFYAVYYCCASTTCSSDQRRCVLSPCIYIAAQNNIPLL